MNQDNSKSEPMRDGRGCPCCGLVMTRGSVAMEHFISSAFLADGALKLYFHEHGAKRRPMLAPARQVGALFCKGCETLVIKGDLAIRRECQKCGLMVYPGRNDCQSCGESFVERQEPPDWVDY
ncbi:MAG: hypothetical protein ACSHX9_03000 [Luteolibacter sp.]